MAARKKLASQEPFESRRLHNATRYAIIFARKENIDGHFTRSRYSRGFV